MPANSQRPEPRQADERRLTLVIDRARTCLRKLRHWLWTLRVRIRGPWIKVGDFYEDCSFHVRVCTVSRMSEDYITGISLMDAHGPSSCSPTHCGVIKVSAEVATEAQRNPRAYFTKSMTRFGIPAEKLANAVDEAMTKLDRHRGGSVT